MQPLYSVDHETRQNSNRVEEQSPSPSEDTPLLLRFPPAHGSERNLMLTLTISLLLIILVMGVVIGIYLLVLQSRAENVLPPVDAPLRLVTRKQWASHLALSPIASSMRAQQVITVHTGTNQCFTTESCSMLLKELQANTSTSDQLLSWNFMVGSNGETYEALVWYQLSTLFPELNSSLVLAFIGDYTEVSPPPIQIQAAKNLLAESVSQQHLSPTYTIHGKGTAYKLFEALKNVPRWMNT